MPMCQPPTPLRRLGSTNPPFMHLSSANLPPHRCAWLAPPPPPPRSQPNYGQTHTHSSTGKTAPLQAMQERCENSEEQCRNCEPHCNGTVISVRPSSPTRWLGWGQWLSAGLYGLLSSCEVCALLKTLTCLCSVPRVGGSVRELCKTVDGRSRTSARHPEEQCYSACSRPSSPHYKPEPYQRFAGATEARLCHTTFRPATSNGWADLVRSAACVCARRPHIPPGRLHPTAKGERHCAPTRNSTRPGASRPSAPTPIQVQCTWTHDSVSQRIAHGNAQLSEGTPGALQKPKIL